MFDVPVSFKIKAYADEMAKVDVGRKDKLSNGTPQQQWTGHVGEFTVYEILELSYLIDQKIASHGFDGGCDVSVKGYRIDVKTMGRTVPVKGEYVNNLMACQMKFDVNAYLFCSYNKTNSILSVCGWMPKESIKDMAEFHKKGDTVHRSDNTTFIAREDMYCVANKDLLGWEIDRQDWFIDSLIGRDKAEKVCVEQKVDIDKQVQDVLAKFKQPELFQ